MPGTRISGTDPWMKAPLIRREEGTMRKRMAMACLIAAALLALAVPAQAKLPGQFSISANGGYMFTYGELELEYKEGVGAIGVNIGSNGLILEVGVPIKYFVPLKAGFSFYGSVNPAALITFVGPTVGFGIKVGPGVEYRSGFFKAAAELGYSYSVSTSHDFYVKGGIGICF